MDGSIKNQEKLATMKNSKNKVFILEVIQNGNGNGLQMRTQCDGFNSFELIGMLEIKKAELIAEITPKTPEFDPKNPNIN